MGRKQAFHHFTVQNLENYVINMKKQPRRKAKIKRGKTKKKQEKTKKKQEKRHFNLHFFPFSTAKDELLERKMKRLEEKTDRKLGRVDESFSLMKKVLVELRKENDELRRDRQFLLDKLKNMLMELEKQKRQIQIAQMAVENEKESLAMNEKFYQTKLKQKAPEEEYEIVLEEKGKSKTEGKSRHVEQTVETPLDELLELIINNGSVKIIDAAKTFNVKEKQIEEWARILEEHDLIEIHYPVIGKSVLRKKSL